MNNMHHTNLQNIYTSIQAAQSNTERVHFGHYSVIRTFRELAKGTLYAMSLRRHMETDLVNEFKQLNLY